MNHSKEARSKQRPNDTTRLDLDSLNAIAAAACEDAAERIDTMADESLPATDTPHDFALDLTARGICPIPVPYRAKGPTITGWQNLRIREEDVPDHFDGQPMNVGVLNGEPSGWLIDIDLDHPAALELADEYLPPTDSTFGRESTPRSHHLYHVTAPIQTAQHQLDNKTMLVELRSTGTQTIAPGSTHESGERIRWDSSGDPATVDPQRLADCVERLAEAAAERIGQPLKRSNYPQPIPNRQGVTASSGRVVQRAEKYIDRCPDAISGQGGHDATLRVACEMVRFDLSDNDAWNLLQRYNAERCHPQWSDKELRHKWDDARKLAEPGERLNGQTKPPERSQNKPTDDPSETYEGPHGLSLSVTNARAIGQRGKAEATFNVLINGQPQAPLTCTTASTAIRESARDLSTWIAVERGDEKLTKPESAKVHQFLNATLPKAAALVERFKQQRQAEQRDEAADGPTMQSIVIGHIPDELGLSIANDDGSLWSETEARNIDQRELERFTSSSMIQAAEQAVDYPEDRIGLSAPVGTLRQYSALAGVEARRRLSREVFADLGPDSEAAARYARAIIRLWTIRERWKKTYGRDATEQAMDSATLAQLARQRIDALEADRPSGWMRVHNAAVDAWLCATPRLGDDGLHTGEPPDAWIGFRYELVNQLPKHSRPELPNTRDMNELGRIARRYGLTADDDLAAPVAMTKEVGRQRRIVVLNRLLTSQILWQWDDGEEPL